MPDKMYCSMRMIQLLIHESVVCVEDILQSYVIFKMMWNPGSCPKWLEWVWLSSDCLKIKATCFGWKAFSHKVPSDFGQRLIRFWPLEGVKIDLV